MRDAVSNLDSMGQTTSEWIGLMTTIEKDDPEHAPDPVPVLDAVYSVAELLDIVRSNPDPDIRVLAAEILYKAGKTDQLREEITRGAAA